MSLIITNHSDNVGTIILNHPETRNSLSNQLLSELIEALEFFEKRRARAVEDYDHRPCLGSEF